MTIFVFTLRVDITELAVLALISKESQWLLSHIISSFFPFDRACLQALIPLKLHVSFLRQAKQYANTSRGVRVEVYKASINQTSHDWTKL